MNDFPAALVIPDLPFHIGPTLTPSNPPGIPDTFPFELGFDPRRAMLVQRNQPRLQELLNRAYRIGLEIGTPLAEDSYGIPYADDFISFIRSRIQPPGRALEIGAGVGYLSKRIKEEGWALDSLEPGVGYSDHWQRYGVEIINDYFPSVRARGPYDLICSYAVLEHIANPDGFLAAIRDHLKPDGVFVMSVPDCGKEIAIGDPAMLIHEHYNYFDDAALRLVLARSGFAAELRPSGFGRAIYASARVLNESQAPPSSVQAEAIETFPARCAKFIQRGRSALTALERRGTLGIYCPTRALAILPKNIECRFFDDSSALHGKYVPPFASRIESRASLVERPTDIVVIMSHTFADKLKPALQRTLPNTRILSLDELLRIESEPGVI